MPGMHRIQARMRQARNDLVKTFPAKNTTLPDQNSRILTQTSQIKVLFRKNLRDHCTDFPSLPENSAACILWRVLLATCFVYGQVIKLLSPCRLCLASSFKHPLRRLPYEVYIKERYRKTPCIKNSVTKTRIWS